MKNIFDCIVIGSGPSGVIASIELGKRKKNVLLIEKNDCILKKLLITGGGRCNLTNLKSNNDFINEISVNRKFLFSTINNFGPSDIMNYFKTLNVDLKVEDNDRVFPVSNSSKTIVNALNKSLLDNNVKINLNETVIDIIIDDKYKTIITNKNRYSCYNIVICTGGMSYKNTGSTGDGYTFAEKLNQPVTALYPAETYLISKIKYPLSGITIEDVEIIYNKTTSNGSLLFTHKGLSGPAIFKISEFIYYDLAHKTPIFISVDLLPQNRIEDLILALNNYDSKKEINSFINIYLPKRLVSFLLEQHNLNNTKICTISNKNKLEIIKKIKYMNIEVVDTGNIDTAIITGGGIDLKYIDNRTFESKINKGIYFGGELLDLHGPMGGYNITIALSSGYTIGNSI